MHNRRLILTLVLGMCSLGALSLLVGASPGAAFSQVDFDGTPGEGALVASSILSVTEPVTTYIPLLMNNWPPPSWHTEVVDARRMFEDFTHRSVALDSQGRPHVAAGYQELYHIWHDGVSWQFEVVDAGPWVGRWASLALDSADRPHISYYDWNNTCLKYAHWDGATWQTQAVECDGNVGWDTNLVLDDADHPHISYTKVANRQDLRYAHWNGAQWIIETIDAGNDSLVGGDNSLALDSTGRPHVSYNDSGPGAEPYSLKHAVRDGGTWITETLETGGFIGSNSLAIDDADHLHIVYEAADEDSHIKYTTWNGTSWHTETILTHEDFLDGISLVLDGEQRPHFSCYKEVGDTRELHYVAWDGATWQNEIADMNLEGVNWMEATSLVLSGNGVPHIAYHLEDLALLGYAHKSGGTWQTGTIDQGGVTGVFASLALDSADRPHIAYYEEQREDLLYAAWDGTNWQITMVDTAGGSSTDGSVLLALDGADRPHISYRAAPSLVADVGLRYATWDGAALRSDSGQAGWQTQYVDQEGRAGRGSSIAVDDAGRPHISYYDYEFLGTGDDSLRYAYWDGAQWQIQSVDLVFQKYLQSSTSLALDGTGYPHIAYLDGDNEDLKYAYWDGATWHVETVDGSDDVGLYPSLALDGDEYPHISYYDRTHGDLKYTRWDGALWQTETVTDTGNVGYFTSLALDSNGHPHISYYDETNGDLKYAHWTGSALWTDSGQALRADSGQAWQIETLATEYQVGYFTSLALDSGDLPHVAYQHHSKGDLQYTWLGR